MRLELVVMQGVSIDLALALFYYAFFEKNIGYDS